MMPTSSRYLTTTKNVSAIFDRIQHGVPPDKFNHDHLKAIGFTSSNDRAVIPLLKDLGFLSGDGSPTQRYREYRDTARSRRVMAQALKDTYPDLFVINEQLSKSDREAVKGRFMSLHDSSETVADAQTRTIFSLLDLADLSAGGKPEPLSADRLQDSASQTQPASRAPSTDIQHSLLPLTYRFEIQLPATKDVEVFRAIFRAIKEELLNG
jgi:hypothetical protein